MKMKKMRLDRMATQRDFDSIEQLAYYEYYTKAINKLVEIVRQQAKQIEVLQNRILKGEKVNG